MESTQEKESERWTLFFSAGQAMNAVYFPAAAASLLDSGTAGRLHSDSGAIRGGRLT